MQTIHNDNETATRHANLINFGYLFFYNSLLYMAPKYDEKKIEKNWKDTGMFDF